MKCWGRSVDGWIDVVDVVVAAATAAPPPGAAPGFPGVDPLDVLVPLAGLFLLG